MLDVNLRDDIKSGNLYKCKLDKADTRYIYILKQANFDYYLVMDIREGENRMSCFNGKEIDRDFELVEDS